MRFHATPRVRIAAAAAALVVLASCSGGPSITTGSDVLPGASTVAATTPPGIPGRFSCDAPSPATTTVHGLQVQGALRGGDPFYVLFDGVDAIDTGTALTTYFRIDGGGALHVVLVGPSDRIVRATGVRPGVPSYAWDRPGEPWRGTLTFPEPGCWRIFVTRGSLDGEAWIETS